MLYYRDTQRSAIYGWDTALSDSYPRLARPISISRCRSLVRRIWLDYRSTSTPPEVIDLGTNPRSYAYGYRWKIVLPRWAQTTLHTLHETAHSLHNGYELGGATHGPEFALLYLDLLEHYGRVSSRNARRLAVQLEPKPVRFAARAAARCRRKE